MYFCTSLCTESMASFESLYNTIEYNVKEALVKDAELKRQNADLYRQIEILRAEREELEKRLSDMESKMKILTITNTILSKEDKQKTKKQINDWVREIDRCVAMLSK
jgi:phage shock protein A